MPNWAMQDFAITGPADDIDRFFTLAFTGNTRGRNIWGENEPTFHFDRVCPIRPRDRRAADGEHVDGVVFNCFRGDIQLHFHIWTSWSYPEHFYLNRFLRDWPRLAFCCAIEEDCGGYGGIIAGFDGTVTDTVEPPGNADERRDQRRRARPLLRRWHALMTAGRPWRVVRPLKYRLYQRIRGNVTFDDYASTFRLETEADARRFARRFKGAVVRKAEGRATRGRQTPYQ